ncbi:MAG: protein-export chaperone SecB [Pseudomonadota bacterium]
MSDSQTPESQSPGAAPATPPDRTEHEPDLLVLTQYVKDLSFENPNAPVIFGQTQSQPKISISVDVRVNAIQEKLAEVILALKVEAMVNDKNAFLVELEYAGIANLTKEMTPEESERKFLIEVPSMLFPFARAIIAGLSRDGGFMPFLMTPIDFELLHRQRQARAAAQAAQSAAAGETSEEGAAS